MYLIDIYPRDALSALITERDYVETKISIVQNFFLSLRFRIIDIPKYINLQGAFNNFPDFFVQPFKIVVDS